MIDYFSYLYANIQDKKKFLIKIKFYSIERVIVRTFCNVILPVYLKVTSSDVRYRLQETDKTKERIIVSLTSFNKRIGRVWITIESILRQTRKPDMIILWLSKEEFPTMGCLPKSLLKLRKRGVKIELREGNLMSHKKYYYTLTEYPNDHMITIDDDIIYPSNFVFDILSCAQNYPDCIISRFAFKISYKSNGELKPYVQWPIIVNSLQPSSNVFFGSGGGAYFQAKILGKEASNISLAFSKCRLADDVWLNTMCRLSCRKVVVMDSLFSLLPIQNITNTHLASINNGENLNDVQIQSLRDYYLKTMNVDVYKQNNESCTNSSC